MPHRGIIVFLIIGLVIGGVLAGISLLRDRQRDLPAEPPSTVEPGQPQEPQPLMAAGQTLRIPIPAIGGADKAVTLVQAHSSKSQKVALTFDVGWIHEPTDQLLAVLKELEVTATFFLRGGWVEDYPHLVRKIAADGHLIANHSLTHGDMTKMSREEMRYELRRTTQLIQEITGQRPFLFRPPYGAYNDELRAALVEEGYWYNVYWTIDSLDWMEPGVDQIVTRIRDRLAGGAIILMHVGTFQTPEALPQIVQMIRERGFETATIPELLPDSAWTGETEYVVQEGDSLESIARKYGTTVEAIVALNGLR
ncbi:MAG: polysaccharide deacetylase family protein [Bacillota bacterium]